MVAIAEATRLQYIARKLPCGGQQRTHALDHSTRSLPMERKGGAGSRAAPRDVSLNGNAAALIGRGVLERVTRQEDDVLIDKPNGRQRPEDRRVP
jgi:hypothetical protein